MNSSKSTKQPSTIRRKKKSLEEGDLIAKVLELFPDLKNFDVDTGELGLFKECWESLQRLLPNKLKTEPLVIGALLGKMKNTPVNAGIILIDLYQIGEVNDKW
jgi:hypothetical protein